ncbi:hypothetical protein L1049_015806 [Liquidambar formosana]|uniref:Retrotransposon Copia-like N-terminal domain-containing protein n=1 Tax=Liquidambar formosana TaxID=63359 RepID=A0AAP0RYH9_LIQFO
MATTDQSEHSNVEHNNHNQLGTTRNVVPDLKTDVSSPFYLHHSDQPGSILVSQSLNGDNFPTWFRAMSTALSTKNKLSLVDDSMTIPSIDSASYSSWRRCNDMVKSWLLNLVSAEISDSIIYASIAREIWIDLQERFAQSNGPAIFQIRDIILCVQDNLII